MNKKFSFASLLVAFAVVFSLVPAQAFAVENGAYTCKITTHYAHPETGVIEDSGGESSMKIGQSMTEGAVGSQGLFEQTANGSYVSLRFLLMDSVSDVNFFIDGKAVSHEVVQTFKGDKDNLNADLRLPVPSESAVIKCKMYVEPMDRNVIFFITMSDLTPGSGDFKVMEGAAQASNEGLAGAQSSALSEIEALKNIDTAQRDLFVANVKSAKTEDEVKEVLQNAQKADQTAQEENALGEAKSDAYKKIDEMNLSAEEAKALKQKVKDAETIDEVQAALGGSSSSNYMYYGLAVIPVIIIAAVVMKKKSAGQTKSDSETK